jgi:uncharacterized protein
VWLIAILGAFIGAISGLVGAGGSFLTVLLLIHAGGLEIGPAIATSLVVVGGTSLVAVVPYAFEGAILWRAALGFGLPSMAGACLGGLVATLISAKILLVIFLLAMVLAAAAMFRQHVPSARGPAGRMPHVAVATSGLLVGGLAGMVGLGGGFAVVPLLTVFGGASVRAAVGTSLLVVVMTKVAGIVGHLPHHLSVDWRTALYLGLAESGGGLAGAHLAKRLSGRALRNAFAGVMLMAALYLLGSTLLR